jgi:hypothetical protein
MFSKLCILGRSDLFGNVGEKDARGHEEDDRRSDVMNVKNNHHHCAKAQDNGNEKIQLIHDISAEKIGLVEVGLVG